MPKKTTKKTTTKTVAKRTVRTQAAPMAAPAATCGCGHECGCHRCGKFKKFVVLLIVFCLGFAVAKFTSCPCKKHPMLNIHPEFTAEGCLNMESIKCPKMLEDLKVSEANADNCITKDEFFAMRKEMMKKHHHHKGPKPVEPQPVEAQPENM